MITSNTHAIFSYRQVKRWFIITIVTSILHYVDNVLFFEHYPEPTWLNAKLVDMFWFVMTPVAGLAIWLFKRQKNHSALIATFMYVAMNLLVLGHYNYQPFHHISFKIHLFIWLEAVSAVILALVASGYYTSGYYVKGSKF